MNRADFTQFMQDTFDTILELNKSKGHDYAGDGDAFNNFRKNATKLGLSPYQVLAVYRNKHEDAIETWHREGGVKSEPIEGRIIDDIVYLFLLLGMIHEDGTGTADLKTAEKSVEKKAKKPIEQVVSDSTEDLLLVEG